MSDTVQTKAMPGKPSVALPINDLEQVLAYSGGNISTITVQYQGITYVQTFSYSGADVTDISQWTPQ